MDSELLIRFLTKKCSDSDTHEINEWISSSEENAKWLFGMEDIWSLKDGLKYSDKKEIEKAWKQFTLSVEPGRPLQNIFIRRTNIKVLWKYGAAAVITVLLITNIYLMLSSSGEGINTINVPLGQYVSLSLSDDTKVWLNAGTQFTYPSRFSGRNRTVEIIGEGFFEVAPNKRKPFVVQSGNVKTTVLGTKFNVHAYDKEKMSVTLLEGAVDVAIDQNNKIKLKPNQQIDIYKEEEFKLTSSVDAHALSQWTVGELYFRDEPLKNIVLTLERKFDVKIKIENEKLASETFDSRTQKDATLTEILDILKKTRNLNYTIEDKNIILY